MNIEGLNKRIVNPIIGVMAVGLLATIPILTACDGGTTAPPETATIPPSLATFPDANLEAAIRAVINKPEDPIYVSDLKPLTVLYASERGISDLGGLEYCVNLQKLDLWENNISDISALAGLTSLQELHLWENNIGDISALAGLTNLQKLDLDNMHISDISVLAGLTNLDWLGLYANNISDISALVENSGLSDGDAVDLSGNPLSAISIDIYIPQLEARGVFVEY